MDLNVKRQQLKSQLQFLHAKTQMQHCVQCMPNMVTVVFILQYKPFVLLHVINASVLIHHPKQQQQQKLLLNNVKIQMSHYV